MASFISEKLGEKPLCDLFDKETDRFISLAIEALKPSSDAIVITKIYGIGKRHHYHLKWLVNSGYPDRYAVSKHSQYIGYIQI